MEVSKRDLIWSYLAQFLSIATGVIVLPAVLRFLQAEEVGFYYVLLSVGALVSLVNFGFTPQFSRNITFVYSGVKTLFKESIDTDNAQKNNEIDYRLLKLVVSTARHTYSVLAWIALGLMATLGTFYIAYVTENFTIVRHAVWIWSIFALSIFFNIGYGYYGALLQGSGQVRQGQQALIVSRLLQIVMSYVVLSRGGGLLGWVIINLLTPFVQRGMSYVFYFTPELKRKIRSYNIPSQERRGLFKILWHNAKRGGVCSFSGFLTNQSTVMLAGAFLSLSDVASFGLMQQLFNVGGSIANTALVTYQPQMSYWIAKGKQDLMRRKMAWCMQLFYVLFLLSFIAIVFLAPIFLRWIGSNSILPSVYIMVVFGLLRFLDGNYWNMCQVFTMSNRYPFVRDVLLTGVGISGLSYVFIVLIPCGIWGLIMGIGICQLIWNDWYWFRKSLSELKMSLGDFLNVGYVELRSTITQYVQRIKS